MRKFIFLAIIMIIPLWIISYVVAHQKELEFDPSLEALLKEEFNMDELSKKHILTIDHLDLSKENLTSVEGIEHFTNLERLDVSENMLTDMSPIGALEKLTEVNLSFNQLEDVSFNSPNIESLNIQGNMLTSLDFIEPLQKVTTLNVRDNNIEDLSPLKANDLLTYLNIRGNKVSSLEPLKGLRNLVNLNVRNNQIHSIEPIATLPLTERLTLNGNQITDLYVLDDKLSTIDEIDFEIGLAPPTFAKNSGFYKDAFELTIEAEKGYEIYYTLDGSAPNAQSPKYDGPIEISKEVMLDIPMIANEKTSSEQPELALKPEEVKSAVTVRAISALKTTNVGSRQYSEPVTATFVLDEQLHHANDLPIISLAVDPRDFFDYHTGIYVPGIWYEEDSLWSGNYQLRGREHEKEAVMELFQNGELSFQQQIGTRINGRATRRFPQKSLRLYSRSDYGQSRFFTTIFEDLPYDEFNLLLLRNSGQDFNSTLLRDGLMHELIKDLPVDVQAYEPTIVLLNGEYWGIHNMREKFNTDYIDLKYNVREKDLILMKGFKDGDYVDFDMKAGTEKDKVHYDELITFVEENDLTEDNNIEHVRSIVDIDNFLHYVAYQVYYANTDSFSNNLMIWRKDTTYTPNAPIGHDGRYRWMLFDLDWGMGFWIHNTLEYDDDIFTYNMVEHVLKDEPRMSLFRHLMTNDNVKDEFIKIMLTLLNNNFETNYVTEKIDELAGSIRPEIPRSIARWNNIESVETWEKNIQELHHFAKERPHYVKQHLMEEFNLTEENIAALETELDLK